MTPQRKLVHDISASAVQMLITQLSGSAIFYLLSDFLPKQDIGVINWSLALLMIIYAMLGCGIDQLVVKKIATGTDPLLILRPYLLHLFITGGGFLILLFIFFCILPGSSANMQVFVLLAISQFLLYLAAPFKQVANGLERFRSLLVMSVIANAIRVSGLLCLIFLKNVSVITVVRLYILSSATELIVCLLVYRLFLGLSVQLRWNTRQYVLLIREAIPQLGVIFFNTAIARFDWVLLGLLSSAVVVADYSFAYKFFELSTLPLLVVGPLLLPKISRLVNSHAKYLSKERNDSLISFLRIEMFIAVYTILVINSCWAPVIDYITNGKYGSSNASVVFILSLCIPFLYINNVLWSLHFSQGRLKDILKIFMTTCFINIGADLMLIPFLKSNGAAIGFVSAILIQTVLYLRKTGLYGYMRIFWYLGIALFAAITGRYISVQYFTGPLTSLLCSSTIYISILLLSGKLTLRNGFLTDSLAKI